MRTIIATLAVVIVIAVLGGLGFIYSGVYHVRATDPHWDLTYWLLDTARSRSIEVHAAGIRVPPGLDGQEKIVIGTEHFAAHCVVCHGAPGVPVGDIAKGLYPQPPNLARAAERLSPAELFWVIKNGIKMSGMPAWADHSDGELWATVAFLQKLPGMSEEDYRKLVMASMAHSGHRNAGGTEGDRSAPSPAPGQQDPRDRDRHQH